MRYVKDPRVDAYIDALRRKPTVGPERREMSA